MRILALDLGTHTGWALLDGEVTTSGTWHLAKPAEVTKQKADGLDRCCDMRPARLLKHIESMGPLSLIAFEDVQFLSTQLQAQLWASLRAIVTLQYPAVKLLAVPVGTLKKAATGFGNAKKEHMAAALIKSAPETYKPHASGKVLKPDGSLADDNEVDAIHLLSYARNKH